MLDPLAVRDLTLRRVEDAGFPAPPVHFPVLWEPGDLPSLRPVRELVERVVVLNVIVNSSYGMPASEASAWLADNGLTGCLSAGECRVVDGELGDVNAARVQIEAINALAWLLGVVDVLLLSGYCGDDLAAKLPDLRSAESLTDWLKRMPMQTRTTDAAIAEWDLYYCLTWGLADANLRRSTSPGTLRQYAYWERRRALEFAFSGTAIDHRDWDHIDLST